MKTVNLNGLIFRADLLGTIGKRLSNGNMYEGDMLRFIEGLDIDGDCVDIGCFIGTHSIHFAKKLNKIVYAFDDDNCDVFRDHIRLNQLHNVFKFDFRLNPPLKLSDYLHSKIGLIKIDVDGSDEIDVLESCKEVIDMDKPKIFIEARTKEKLKEIENYLTDYDNIEVFNATPTYFFKHDNC